MIDVSIVLITWNIRELLHNCLSSIYSYTKDINIELILVDNNSIDGTKDLVRSKFPQVKLIENPQNRGVAPARNQGIAISKGKYVFILDADTELVENSILQLYHFMESNPTVGLVGSKLVDREGNLQLTSRRFPTLSALILRRFQSLSISRLFKSLQNHVMSDWEHDATMAVDYVIGACQFIRAESIKKIGLYDENIFYGPEDLDFCMRIWRGGYKVCYFPFTRIYHLEQRITKKKPFSILTVKHLFGVLYLYVKYKGNFSRFV